MDQTLTPTAPPGLGNGEARLRHSRADTAPGLVWAYRFDEQGRAEPWPNGQRPVLSELQGGFAWLHFDLVDLRVGDWCKAQTALPERARHAFLSTDAHLRIDHAEGRVWGVFADLEQEFGQASVAPAQLHFVMGERWLVTGRRRPLRGVGNAREKVDGGARYSCPSAVLEAIVESVLERVHALTEELEKDIDQTEDRILVRPRELDEDGRLATVRHELVRYNRQLSKFSAALRRFVDWAAEAVLPRDMHTTAQRLLQQMETLRHDVEALQERARLLQEEASDRRASEMNRHLYVLSVLTALLMPPTLVASLFGMNTGGLPFTGSAYGSAAALGLGLVSAGIISWLFRRMRRGNRRS